MNTRLAILIITFCVFALINAQEWISINPSFAPPGNYNLSLGTFVDETNGWFTEIFPGRTWRTIDGGLTWNIQIDSSDVWSYNIDFINSTYGWILGKRISDYVPFIKHTNNGGESWETFSLPGVSVAINFLDSMKGFAGGDSIYCTNDGGESWHAQAIDSDVRFGVMDIYFVDEQYGWAVGGSSDYWDMGIILKTIDGGETWQINKHPAGIIGNAVYFTDSTHGCIAGFNPFSGGLIRMTIDGGENWESPGVFNSWLNDVVFTNDSTGWVVGDYGFIGYTDDGGQTWEQVESGTNADLNRIVFFEDGTVGYIFGTDNTLLKYDRTAEVAKGDDFAVPSKIKLHQNYPNPFNPRTTIYYELNRTVFVKLTVYDVRGKEVTTLVDRHEQAGIKQVTWNGTDTHGKPVASGLYIYILSAISTESKQTFHQSRKLVLLR